MVGNWRSTARRGRARKAYFGYRCWLGKGESKRRRMADATILIVEDEEKMRRLFDLVLRPEGYRLIQADSGEAGLKFLEEGGIDLVLTHLQMAKVSGLDVLEHVTRDHTDLPVVIITGHGTVKSAVEAMEKGAFDYVSKPVDNDELKIVVRRALEMRRLTQEHRGLSQELRDRFNFGNIVGRSAELAKVKEIGRASCRERV